MTEKYHVPALIRSLRIIEYLALNGEASLTVIQKSLTLPRSSTFHLLNTLQDAGYAKYGSNGNWRLTSKIHGLSNIMFSHLDLRNHALPVMRQFSWETGLGSNLGLIVGDEAIYGAKVEAEQHLLSKAWLGKPLSLMGSSLGKILMAWRPEKEILFLLRQNPPCQTTPNTQADIRQYIASLETVRREGLAWDREEVTPGVTCFAIPILDSEGKVCAAISASAATPAFVEEKIPLFREKLFRAAREIEKRLGE